jgi:hypothetical protein
VEPWWNNIDRGIFLIRPPELSSNPNSSHLVANEEELEKEIMNLAFEVPSVMLRSDFFHAVKSYMGGDSGFTSTSKKVVLLLFVTLKIHRVGRF